MSRKLMIATYRFYPSREREENSWVYLNLSNFSLAIIAEFMGAHCMAVKNIINKFN